jgi:hypothetical protein
MTIKNTWAKAKRILEKDRNSSSAFEWTMTTPFTFAVVLVALFIMLLLFSWVSYGSLANNIATDLNFRQTGLERASTWVDEHPTNGGLLVRDKSGNYLSTSKVIMVNGGSTEVTEKYKKAVIYHMNEYANQFYFPYANFDEIDVSIIRKDNGAYVVPDMTVVTLSDSDEEDDTQTARTSQNFSGSIVKVDIKYTFFPVKIMNGMAGWSGLNIVSSGYAVIT